MSLPILQRNDPMGRTTRYRSRLAGDPSKGDNIESVGLVRKAVSNAPLGATTIYTVPTGKRARWYSYGGFFVHNPSGGSITYDLHHVPSGGSAGSTNKMRETITVGTMTDSIPFIGYDRHVFRSGDSLVINTGGAGLNVWAIFLEELADACAWDGGFVGNLGTGDTTIYTVPALRTFVMKDVLAFNTSGSTINLTMNARESGVAAATTNQFQRPALLTNTHYESPYFIAWGVTLSEGGIISAKGSLAGLNVWVDGILL